MLREDGVKTTMSKKRSRSEADDDGATWYIKYPGEEKRSGQTDFIFTIGIPQFRLENRSIHF